MISQAVSEDLVEGDRPCQFIPQIADLAASQCSPGLAGRDGEGSNEPSVGAEAIDANSNLGAALVSTVSV